MDKESVKTSVETITTKETSVKVVPKKIAAVKATTAKAAPRKPVATKTIPAKAAPIKAKTPTSSGSKKVCLWVKDSLKSDLWKTDCQSKQEVQEGNLARKELEACPCCNAPIRFSLSQSKMSIHTGGPWCSTRHLPDWYAITAVAPRVVSSRKSSASGKRIVAFVSMRGDDRNNCPASVGECLSNVRLVEEAPNMFKALCAAHDLLLEGKQTEAREQLLSAISAITEERIPDNF